MMSRTQISLEPELHAAAKRRASEMGVSLAEYMRGLVRADTEPQSDVSDASALFGLFDSGGSDVAQHKDAYVGEAVEQEWRRKLQRRE